MTKPVSTDELASGTVVAPKMRTNLSGSSMLTINCHVGARFKISNDIYVSVLSVDGDHVRLGIKAPGRIGFRSIDNQQEREQTGQAVGSPASSSIAEVPPGPHVLRFLGTPTGVRLDILHTMLATALTTEGSTTKAYLSKVEYLNDKGGIALIIERRKGAKHMAPAIARRCRFASEIDLLFFDQLTPEQAREVRERVSPFYIAPIA